ncbi:hypothetical protein PSQ19_09170 [Devosia algicola]|uniref:Uncharacterized protein n=1 Tax=Devosia algicola TaxID=3026418 RepID=A0ABY7YTF9_9HYPH|nr:hypothetical protein [Devosia algicola]WDR04140.1 hypothetical protein PSQ19_09170 [Devosia algicola]
MTQFRPMTAAHSNRFTASSIIQGYDGHTHLNALLWAMVPALALLSATTALLLFIS